MSVYEMTAVQIQQKAQLNKYEHMTKSGGFLTPKAISNRIKVCAYFCRIGISNGSFYQGKRTTKTEVVLPNVPKAMPR